MPLNTVRQILQKLAKLGDGMPVSYALAFVEIASDPGLSITTLADRLSMPLSTVSRIVSNLSDPNKYNLTIVTIAADEKRRKVISLTPVGEKAAKSF